jgi:hypothetical protein
MRFKAPIRWHLPGRGSLSPALEGIGVAPQALLLKVPCGPAIAMSLPVLNATALTETGEDPVVTKYYFFALSKTGGSRVAMDRDGGTMARRGPR